MSDTDDDDLPAAQVASAGANADPVNYIIAAAEIISTLGIVASFALLARSRTHATGRDVHSQRAFDQPDRRDRARSFRSD